MVARLDRAAGAAELLTSYVPGGGRTTAPESSSALVPPPGGLSTDERPAEGFDAVGESAQPGPELWVGAASSSSPPPTSGFSCLEPVYARIAGDPGSAQRLAAIIALKEQPGVQPVAPTCEAAAA